MGTVSESGLIVLINFIFEHILYIYNAVSEYVTVDETTGLIHISEINRDALKQEVFPFNVSKPAEM